MSLFSKPKPVVAASPVAVVTPNTGDDRELEIAALKSELTRYRQGLAEATRVCREAARGNLEPRMLNVPTEGDLAELYHGINQMLDLTDAFIRTWLPRLSSHPRVAAWLTTDGLIRNFVTVVSNITEGKTPAGRVPVLKPAGTFQVVERGGRLFVDPRSYERYNELAAAFASVDAQGAAQLYATLKPRLQEASAELGAATSFDATLEQALITLLKTPIRDQPLAVEPAGIGYRYADASLDGLNGAQQHLLRLGPANARLVQRQLRELALALGIPASRLPPP